MTLFSHRQQKADLGKIKTIKTWVYEALAISKDIPISISQLTCTEPGCPPIETVISVMKTPTETYKLHKAVGQIQYDDICQIRLS